VNLVRNNRLKALCFLAALIFWPSESAYSLGYRELRSLDLNDFDDQAQASKYGQRHRASFYRLTNRFFPLSNIDRLKVSVFRSLVRSRLQEIRSQEVRNLWAWEVLVYGKIPSRNLRLVQDP